MQGHYVAPGAPQELMRQLGNIGYEDGANAPPCPLCSIEWPASGQAYRRQTHTTTDLQVAGRLPRSALPVSPVPSEPLNGHSSLRVETSLTVQGALGDIALSALVRMGLLISRQGECASASSGSLISSRRADSPMRCASVDLGLPGYLNHFRCSKSGHITMLV